MGRNYVSAPERLRLILPWINGDPLSRTEIIWILAAFLRGPAGGDYLGLVAEPRPGGVSARQLTRLRAEVLAILSEAVPAGRPRPTTSAGRALARTSRFRVLSSLQFAVSRGADEVKLSALSTAERRAYLGAGVYAMAVTGRLRDVVLYTVMRTLTEPGAVLVTRCPAPAAGDPSRSCGRWFVSLGKRRGRSAIYCSDVCRVRAWKQQQKEA